MVSSATYPILPGSKTDGTSAQAAERMAETAGTLRERVRALFGEEAELTADECAVALNESVLAVRPRVSELARLHVIEDTEKRRANNSGMTATVWRKCRPKVWRDDLLKIEESMNEHLILQRLGLTKAMIDRGVVSVNRAPVIKAGVNIKLLERRAAFVAQGLTVHGTERKRLPNGQRKPRT